MPLAPLQPVKLVSICTEDLDQATRSTIIDLCIAAHHDDVFKNLFIYVPSGGLHFLAYHDDVMVTHAMITTRWLQPAGFPELKTAYVDAVATLPEYQGQGYGSAVMLRLATEADPNYILGCLETDREAFYARLGWKTWLGPLAGRKSGELVPTPSQKGIMVLPLSKAPSLDLHSSLSIECQEGRIW